MAFQNTQRSSKASTTRLDHSQTPTEFSIDTERVGSLRGPAHRRLETRNRAVRVDSRNVRSVARHARGDKTCAESAVRYICIPWTPGSRGAWLARLAPGPVAFSKKSPQSSQPSVSSTITWSRAKKLSRTRDPASRGSEKALASKRTGGASRFDSSLSPSFPFSSFFLFPKTLLSLPLSCRVARFRSVEFPAETRRR